MKIILVNHIITAVKAMLTPLVQSSTLSGDEAKDLLVVIVLHAIKNDTIELEEE